MNNKRIMDQRKNKGKSIKETVINQMNNKRIMDQRKNKGIIDQRNNN